DHQGTLIYELATDRSHVKSCWSGRSDSCRRRDADPLMRDIFALGLEVSGGIGRDAAAGAAPDGPRLLRPRGGRTEEPLRPRVSGACRPSPGLYLRGAPLRVSPLQPAVCRPALRVCLRLCGSEAG